MPFCSKCGAELASDELFCHKCGNQTGQSKAISELASLSKEESIEFASKLAREYRSLDRLRKEIIETEAVVRSPLPEMPRHSAFKFFWPYLLNALVVFFGILIVGGIIAAAAGSEFSTGFEIVSLAAFIGLAVTLLIGGNIARKNRAVLNKKEEISMQELIANVEEKKKTLVDLKERYSTQELKLSELEAAIPSKHRNKISMEGCQALLKANKAENMFDALNKLG